MQTLITRFDLENRLRKENLRSYLPQCTLATVAVLIFSAFKRLVLPLMMDLFEKVNSWRFVRRRIAGTSGSRSCPLSRYQSLI